jgi:hypothetical protein
MSVPFKFASYGVRTHAELPPVDLKSTPLTTRANWHLLPGNRFYIVCHRFRWRLKHTTSFQFLSSIYYISQFFCCFCLDWGILTRCGVVCCLCVGRLSVCWAVVCVLGGCLGVGWLSVCWVVVSVLGGGLCVGWLSGCWVVVCVLDGCLRVGWLSECWVVVCVLGGCLGVGWLSVCWVAV